jgi:hypothetical protein
VTEYGHLPLSFEANEGQSTGQAKSLARGSGYALFLTDRAAALSLTKKNGASVGDKKDRGGWSGD